MSAEEERMLKIAIKNSLAEQKNLTSSLKMKPAPKVSVPNAN
jgi:hypothetical protein